MEVFEALKERSSVRDYRSEPVGACELMKLKEAALLAPTSLNLRDQYFYFISDKEILSRMSKAIIEVSRQRGEYDYLERLRERDWKVFFGAPLLVIIAVNLKNNYIDVDAGIAVQSLALEARSLGLDSVIMAAPDRIFVGDRAECFNRLIGIPEGYRFAISIAIGWRNRDFKPHEPAWDRIVDI